MYKEHQSMAQFPKTSGQDGSKSPSLSCLLEESCTGQEWAGTLPRSCWLGAAMGKYSLTKLEVSQPQISNYNTKLYQSKYYGMGTKIDT